MKINLRTVKQLKINKLPSWPPLFKLLAFVVIFILFFIFGYIVAVSHQVAQYEQSKQAETNLKQRYEYVFSETAHLPVLQQQIAELVDHFDFHRNTGNSNLSAREILSKIENIVKETGLQLIMLQPMAKRKTDFYEVAPIRVQLKGGYQQIAKFIVHVYALSEMVTIGNFMLQKDLRERTGSRAKGQGLITASFIIDINRLVDHGHVNKS
jgi:Tfp pilus assembly protein PilO